MRKVPVVSAQDVAGAHAAARCVVEAHRRVSAFLRPGLGLPELDRFIARTLEELQCRSCFLGYRMPRGPAFPSHACLSVNNCVVHGTAGSHAQPLRGGDVLKVDIGVVHHGWIGDAAWTYAFAPVSEEAARLMACGKEALRRGIAVLKPGTPYIEWARAVQTFVEQECGFHLVRGLGGHGYGRQLHMAPFVSNTVPAYAEEWPEAYQPARPGTLLALEPMIAAGTGRTIQRPQEWPVYTADGSLAVHYEHDVLISDHGPVVLTEGLEQLRDVIE